MPPRLDLEARKRAAKNLEVARIMAGYKTASAAALALGKPHKTYYDHEKGNRAYTAVIDVYAAKFGVTPSDLLFGESTPKQPASGHLIPHIDFTIIGTKPLEKLLKSAPSEQLFHSKPKLFVTKNPDRAMTSPAHAYVAPGDLLAFCPGQPKSGDYVLATVSGMPEPIFRVYHAKRSGGAIFKALYPTFPDIVAKPRQWQVVALLQFIVKSAESIG